MYLSPFPRSFAVSLLTSQGSRGDEANFQPVMAKPSLRGDQHIPLKSKVYQSQTLMKGELEHRVSARQPEEHKNQVVHAP